MILMYLNRIQVQFSKFGFIDFSRMSMHRTQVQTYYCKCRWWVMCVVQGWNILGEDFQQSNGVINNGALHYYNGTKTWTPRPSKHSKEIRDIFFFHELIFYHKFYSMSVSSMFWFLIKCWTRSQSCLDC